MNSLRSASVVLAVWLAIGTTHVGAAPVVNSGCRVAAGYQEFYVLGREAQIYDIFADIEVFGRGSNTEITQGKMESVVTLTATTDGQTILYDHWEDGFDPDPLTPGATTERFVLAAGEVLSLKSDGSGPGVRNVVPTVPRGTALRYDGGDRVASAGGAVSLVHSTWPEDFALVGGAMEVYSQQSHEGVSFVVPVGTDTYDGDDGDYGSFRYVWLVLQAFADGTTVAIDNGTTETLIELQQGQSWSSRGAIDEAAGQALEILQGTTVVASRPLQAALITASDGLYQSRFFTLLPELAWGTDYVTPFIGPVDTVKGANIYIFNPSDQELQVTAYDNTDPAGRSFPIPAGGLASYVASDAMGHLLPVGSSARLTADRPFWGIIAVDWTGTVSDWGMTLLPTHLLTDTLTVSWAPGADDQGGPAEPDDNSSPVYVVPIANDAIICADLDGDGNADDVDTDGDGNADPGNADFDVDGTADAGCYVTDLLGRGGLRIFDPLDFDNTGTQLFGTVPFTASWGQDPDIGRPSQNHQLDLGYNLLPSGETFIDPVLTVDVTVDQTCLYSEGGLVRYTATAHSHGFGPMATVELHARMPIELTYQPGSTVLTLPDATVLTDDPSEAVGPSFRDLTWSVPGELASDATVVLTYDADAAPAVADQRYRTQVSSGANYGSIRFLASQCADVFKGAVRLDKRVDRPTGSIGDTLTYTLFFDRSTAPAAPDRIGPLRVRDVVPHGLSYIPGSAYFAFDSGFAGLGSYDPATRTVTFPEFDSTRSLDENLTAAFSFRVTIDPGVADRVCNQADIVSYGGSSELTIVSSPRVCASVDRPHLGVSVAAPSTVGTAELFDYRIELTNDGSAPAIDVRVIDLLPARVHYLPDSLRLTVGTAPPVTLTDAVDTDPGDVSGGAVHLEWPSLGGGQRLELRFTTRAPTGVAVDLVNRASVASAFSAGVASNLVVTRTVPSAATIELTDDQGTPMTVYDIGDEVFLWVVDADQDLDDAALDTVTVNIVDPVGGDSESVVLTETGPAVGVFVAGPVATTLRLGPTPDNAVLELQGDSQLSATYTDPDDPGEVRQANASIALPSTPSAVQLVDGNGVALLALVRDTEVFVEVTDGDEDRGNTTLEVIAVALLCPTTGDSESLPATESATNAGTFRTTRSVVLVPATGAPVPDDGRLEVIGGASIRADYVDSDDPGDASSVTRTLIGVDLLRNDELTATSPLSAPLSSIFVVPGRYSLDPLGGDGIPGPGEGATPSAPGSQDDDDLYLALIGTDALDPDGGIVTDPTRPLVFYQTTAAGNLLRLVRQGADVRLTR